MPVHDWTRVDAGIFHDFHTVWLVGLRVRLGQILPPDYYVLAEQKALGLGPDILAMGRGSAPGGNGATNGAGPASGGPGDAKLTAAPPKVRFVAQRPFAYKQRAIVVRRVENDRIVAVVEIVSPGNKSSGHAIRAFVAKADEFLEAGVHLLIVDLFPPTPRDPNGFHEAIWGADPAIPALSKTQPLCVAAYEVGPEVRAYVQPVGVGELLPDMPLFLEPGQHVPVPLEETYMAAFAAVPRPWSEILVAPAPGGGA
ncbi:MAG TPA: DUF4058 family protein [Gemmataceae bacterium]|nr:DUF4058 family protein [Gemmataceae bacterium]